MGTETGLQTGQNIPDGGTLIVGQYQGSYEGGFNSTKLMFGKMADLNIWSTALTINQIIAMSSKCFTSPSSGRVVSWTDITGMSLQGSLAKNCPATCPL